MPFKPKFESHPKITGTGVIKYPHVTTWQVLREYLLISKQHWFLGLLTCFGWVLATVVYSVITPLFYKRFFDIIAQSPLQNPDAVALLIRIVIVLLIFNVLGWVGYRIAAFANTYFESAVVRKLNMRAFDYIIYHSHYFFINNFAGAMTQRVNRYSRAFKKLSDQVIENILPLTIKVVGTIAVLIAIAPNVAGLIAIWIVIFMTCSYIFAKVKLKYDIMSAQADSRLVGTLSDSITNHGTVQLFNGYKNESSLFKKATDYFTDIVVFRWNIASAFEAFQSLSIVIVEFLVFYFGITYWSTGQITIGTFVLVQAYILAIGNSLWTFGKVVRNTYEATAEAKEMVEILYLKHEIEDAPHAKELQISKGIIEFKNVGFHFGKESNSKSVFDSISFDVKTGEKIAIIGPSGAGKSTLVKLLLRLHDIQKGEILIDGQNIKEVTQESLRNNISLVPQDSVLFHRTLLENIRYGKRDATDEEVVHAAKLAHCDVFINEFPHKYETFVGERGVKLSGGERQRVAIARAILKNAPILVLDEATSSLDSHSEALIQDALHTLMKGKTTIVIAHRLSTIRNMDRIIVVSKGGVVEEGSHNELIKKPNGTYAKLWALQAGGFANKSIEELLESEN